jgi:hypothetical protein
VFDPAHQQVKKAGGHANDDDAHDHNVSAQKVRRGEDHWPKRTVAATISEATKVVQPKPKPRAMRIPTSISGKADGKKTGQMT